MRLGLVTVCAVTILFPRFVSAQADRVTTLMREGNALDHAGEYARASALFREALRLAETSHDPRLALALNAVANTDQELGRYADAERGYRRALAIAGANGKFTTTYALTLDNLGIHYVETGRRQKAEELLRQSLAVYEQIEPADSVELALSRNALANLVVDDGQYAEAERLIEASIAVFHKHPNRETGDEAVGLNNLGVVRRAQGRYAEAVELFEEAARITETELGANHPTLMRALNNVGTLYAQIGRNEDADRAFRRSISIAESRFGPSHPLYARVVMNYAGFLRTCGRKSEAKNLETKANAALRDNARSNGRGMTVDVSSFRH